MPLPSRALALLLAALVTSGAMTPHQAPQCGSLPRVGTIEGKLELPRTPARRRAERYLSGAVETGRAVQPIPAVALLRGQMGTLRPDPSSVRLAQRDTTFTPAVVVVGVGSTVAFPNGDPFFHNVFSYSSPQRFDLGRYPQGESKSIRFDAPGIVRIYCEVHETMRSAVIVVENPFHAIVDEGGSFTIRDVPEGNWQLEIWHPDLRGKVVEVTVDAGGTTRVAISLS
jgi:plastocyanin